ncbi:MAG: hypothetical protein ABIF09_02660 [Gemmatimonadota bacterium]
MKSVLAAFLLACALSVSAFRGAEGPTRDFLAVLGIDKASAEANVFSSFWSDYASHPTGDLVRAVVLGDRPAMVREVVQFAREYTASPEFLERYAAARQELRPKLSEGPKSGEEMVNAMKADMQKQIAEIQAQADQSPPDLKEMLLENVAMLREQLVALDDPDNPYLDPEFEVGLAAGAAAEQADYDEKVAEWESLYPENAKVRIAQRLEEVLALCSGVDFSAKLIDDDYGKKLFASTAYEMKSGEWKACYRAGPEAVEAARAALGEWLAEIR